MDCSSSVNRNKSKDDHRTDNIFWRRNLRGEYSSTSGYFVGSYNVADVGVSPLKNQIFNFQSFLLDVVVVDVSPIVSGDIFV